MYEIGCFFCISWSTYIIVQWSNFHVHRHITNDNLIFLFILESKKTSSSLQTKEQMWCSMLGVLTLPSLILCLCCLIVHAGCSGFYYVVACCHVIPLLLSFTIYFINTCHIFQFLNNSVRTYFIAYFHSQFSSFIFHYTFFYVNKTGIGVDSLFRKF